MTEPQPILITSYQGPDLDGFAGAIAYTEWMNAQDLPALCALAGEPQDEVKYFMTTLSLPYPEPVIQPESYQSIILVDHSRLLGLPAWINPERIIEVVDHRLLAQPESFPRAKMHVEMVGAAATLIAEKFASRNMPISRASGLLLYGAIISNTINFQAGVTTPRDRSMADWLTKQVEPPPTLAHDMFAAKSDVTGTKLIAKIESDFAEYMYGGVRLGVAQMEILGAEQVVQDRQSEILQALQSLKQRLNLKYTFLSLIEIDGGYNIFITHDELTQTLLTETLGVTFFHGVGKRKGLMMRKEIIPLLKKRLEEGAPIV